MSALRAVPESSQRVFWNVYDSTKSIIIELHNERFTGVIVEVNDPLFAVEQIKAKLSA